MTKLVRVWNLGRLFYDQSNKIQRYLSRLHSFDDGIITEENVTLSKEKGDAGVLNTLLIVEHEPVYTAGLRDCLSSSEQAKLLSLGAQYRRVDRGGLATFHGPGQLTAYPILNLRHFKPSVKWYVDRLEEVAIHTCAALGIEAERSPHTGVWVNDRKICAIGVHVSRGITTHGLAINCTTDLTWFEHIVPCGIRGKGVTSLTKELSGTSSIESVLPVFQRSFQNVFDCRLIEMTPEEKERISNDVEKNL